MTIYVLNWELSWFSPLVAFPLLAIMHALLPEIQV